MQNKKFIVSLPGNPRITINFIPGHFATVNAHVSHYVDISNIKSNALIAKNVARELAMPYLTTTLVDTIVCMDTTEVIAAYMAEELLLGGQSVMNSDREIYIVTPIINVNKKLIFNSNVCNMILNKNIILLVASVSSGRTIDGALECLDYYGGKLVGISSLFRSQPENTKQKIFTLFTGSDVPGYQVFNTSECVLCKGGQKLDAIVSSEGYTTI